MTQKHMHYATLGVMLVVGFLAGSLYREVSPGLKQMIPASCRYEGKTYSDGEGFRASDACNTCSCERGQVSCTEIACGQYPLPENPQNETKQQEEDPQVENKQDLLEEQYPAFADWDDTSLPPHTVKVVVDGDTHYFAYVVSGSGIEQVVEATCFRVDGAMRVARVGTFPNPADSYTGYEDVDPRTCTGIKFVQ